MNSLKEVLWEVLAMLFLALVAVAVYTSAPREPGVNVDNCQQTKRHVWMCQDEQGTWYHVIKVHPDDRI